MFEQVGGYRQALLLLSFQQLWGQNSLACLMPESSVETAWHEPQEILTSSVTSLMANL